MENKRVKGSLAMLTPTNKRRVEEGKLEGFSCRREKKKTKKNRSDGEVMRGKAKNNHEKETC